MSAVADIHVSPGTSAELVDLIWTEFFFSRGRGQSMAIHAPYVLNSDAIRSVAATTEDGVAGGLILKDYRLAGQVPVSMVGFVCVRPANRGQHLSRLLLRAAIEDTSARGIAGLVLWTATPQVYAAVGFQPDPRDVFFLTGPLTGRSSPRVETGALDLAPRGLPAFAQGALRLETSAASATLLNTAKGSALVEWSGNDIDVIDLLSVGVRGPLWVNAISSDSLPRAMERCSGTRLENVSSKRLALSLGRHSIFDFPEIRILDRI